MAESKKVNKTELEQWLGEEALNMQKMLNGVKRLNFTEWKKQRDERARTVSGGSA